MAKLLLMEIHMEMSCEGCSNAAIRVLNRLQGEGVVCQSRVSLKEQKVTVTTSLPSDHVMQALAKTGKKVTLISVRPAQ